MRKIDDVMRKIGWRKRTNEELTNLYKEAIIAYIKRLYANRMIKVVLQRKPIG